MNVKLPSSDTEKGNIHTVAKPIPKLRVGSNPHSSSTARLREYFSQFASNTNYGGKGDKKIITPTKRKLLEGKCVSNLVPVFHNSTDNPPGESSASPAKRRRFNSKVKHSNS